MSSPSTALATAPHQSKPSTGLSIRHGRPLLTQEALVEEGQQRQLLLAYVAAHMVEGIDFGVIPGTGGGKDKGKKTLLKPGAEKMTDLFRCQAEFEIASVVEDWDRPLLAYTFRCRIRSRETGEIVAEGFGSCNSRESKYRYRNSDRKCPACGAAAIIKGKAEYGGGYVCLERKGGCKAKFRDGDPSIEGQVLGKVENPDVADVANTILKMAKKRAHVDAAIALARCSDMFTQDAEDFAPVQQPQTSVQDAEVQEPQEAPKPVDPAKLKEVILAKGWSWLGVIRRINQSQGTSYPVELTTKPESLDQAILGDFFDWLQKQPDAPKKQPEQPKPEAGSQQQSSPAMGAVFTMLSKNLAGCATDDDLRLWEKLHDDNKAKLSADEAALLRDELQQAINDIDAAKAESNRS